MSLLVKCYDNKMVKSPFILIIVYLIKPQMANQQQKKQKTITLTPPTYRTDRTHPPLSTDSCKWIACCIFRPALGCWALQTLVEIVIFNVFAAKTLKKQFAANFSKKQIS